MRKAFGHVAAAAVLAACVAACRSTPTAHVLSPGAADLVGTQRAGAETYRPLVEQAVMKLLSRQRPSVQTAAAGRGRPLRVCFVGIENRSAEEMGDFKDQVYEMIDTMLENNAAFQPVSRRYLQAALRETGLRPDQLFIPANMRQVATVLEQQGQPVDCLLFAKLTSGTTAAGKDVQRDYMLTLEVINVQTGDYDKESALLRKHYHR